MRNIYSNIFKPNKQILTKTIYYLKKNKIVALPTETVYGLAGNAYSSKSIKKIYRLKKRPNKNPLIIHYLNLKSASEDINFNSNLKKLYNYFCPGPITFVLKIKKNSKIDKMARANLNTVAIRFPKNNIARKILKKIDFPLAMPSANLSSQISPISAYDVVDEFKKNIKIVINGGNSKIGLESTVVDLTSKPKILRPGIITKEKIQSIIKKKVYYQKKIKLLKAPGGLTKHYSPGIPIVMNANYAPIEHAHITFGMRYKNKINSFNLSKKSNLNEAAKNLYKIFRKIKKLGYKKIYISKIPRKNIGIAINDRIKRAAN